MVKKQESGQAIVLIALMMVVLLGMLALAVDGGDLFFKQRDAQNGTDAMALAAAASYCQQYLRPDANTDWETNGLRAGEANGFVNGEGGNTVTLTKEQIWGDDGLDYIQRFTATINSPGDSYFVELLYTGPWETTVSSVSDCVIPFTEIHEITLWANSQTCQNSMNIAQSSVIVNGGSLSKSDYKATGDNIALNGDVYYGSTFESQATITSPHELLVLNDPPRPVMPVLYESTDFLEGGKYAEAAQAEGLYFYDTNNLMVNANKPGEPLVLEGLYVGQNGIQMMGSNYVIGPKGATFIGINGKVTVSANSITLTPYLGANHLLVATWAENGCGEPAVALSASSASLNGIIYAPNGPVRVDASTTLATVAIFANAIDLHGSQLTLEWYDAGIDVWPRATSFRE